MDPDPNRGDISADDGQDDADDRMMSQPDDTSDSSSSSNSGDNDEAEDDDQDEEEEDEDQEEEDVKGDQIRLDKTEEEYDSHVEVEKDEPEGEEDEDPPMEEAVDQDVQDEDDEEEDDDDDDDEDDDEDDDDDDEEDDDIQAMDSESKKRGLILERCRAIEQDNEHLANRIYEIQTLIKKERRKKRLLMMKLDQIGDNYRNVPIIMPPKEVENFQLAMASGGLSGKGDKNASGAPKRKPGRPPKGPVGRPPKKPREGKDPNLPKRPQNPFFQYCQEQRARVHREYQREQNVELSKKELTKILAQRWHEMGSEQKKIYNLLFEEEKQRYSANISEYQLAKAKESLLKS